jgi:DMSO/TMAO reductase YedYZ heme-binding membrane subunit
VYISAICAVIHFAWKVKVFTGDPVLYAVVLTILLGFRLAWFAWKRPKPAPRAAQLAPRS